MQKLYYIDDQILETMKNEVSQNLGLYQQTEPWCLDLLETDLDEIEKPVQLKIELGDKGKNDLANAILLYEAMKDIPFSVATNENFWAFLTHTVYWDYMRSRWSIEDAQQDEVSYIHTRYMFSTKNKRFYRNGLSRLWYYAALTYDETNCENPYFYTELMLKNQDLAGLILETTSISRNFKVLKATLEVINRLDIMEEQEEIDKIKGKREFIRDVMKKINFIGAITIWDSLNHNEIVEKLWAVITKDIKILSK